MVMLGPFPKCPAVSQPNGSADRKTDFESAGEESKYLSDWCKMREKRPGALKKTQRSTPAPKAA